MLTIVMKEGKGVVSAAGDLPEIMTDLTIAVKELRDELVKKDKEDGMIFDLYVKEILPLVSSIGDIRDAFENADKDEKEK